MDGNDWANLSLAVPLVVLLVLVFVHTSNRRKEERLKRAQEKVAGTRPKPVDWI